MNIALILLNVAFFLAVSLWLGGLVMLVLGTWQVENFLQGRRTEAWQIASRMRGLFRKIELGALLVMWVTSIALLILHALSHASPHILAADAIKLGFMLVGTLAALYSAFYLAPRLAKQEALVGSYQPVSAGQDDQVKVRRKMALLHLQTKGILLTNSVLAALTVIAAVAAM
jgi:hypothetical protein